MAESAVQTGLLRTFSTCELTVLRARRIGELEAARYPAQLSASGICDLIEAGVGADVARAADPSLSARALLGFLAIGADPTDVDYDGRFVDPKFLADAGIPASRANAYSHHLSEIDIVRLHEAGFGPRDNAGFEAGTWTIAEMVSMAAVGVTAQQAADYRRIPGLPPEMVGECIRAGVEPAALAEWLAAVSPAIRATPPTLVRTALVSGRVDDAAGFVHDLVRVAARSVLAASDDPDHTQGLAQLLLDVVHGGGVLSTTIPDSWTRERLLFVGPDGREVVSIVVIPGEPLVFSYGDLGLHEARARIRSYLRLLGRPPADPPKPGTGGRRWNRNGDVFG